MKIKLIALVFAAATAFSTPAAADEAESCASVRNFCIAQWSVCRNGHGTCQGGCGYGTDPICDSQFELVPFRSSVVLRIHRQLK